jgi:alpha/beta hydrolase family protein
MARVIELTHRVDVGKHAVRSIFDSKKSVAPVATHLIQPGSVSYSESEAKPGLLGLLREARVVPELFAFSIDALIYPDHFDARHRTIGVLLIPGLLACDASLYPLGERLRALGYQVFFSGIRCNADCPATTLPRLETALNQARRATGGTIVIIGHSLGGIYARELAVRFPERIERVILLGSPIKDPMENATSYLTPITRLIHWRCNDAGDESSTIWGVTLSQSPPRVPETLIYTRSDGVVRWRSCLETGPGVEAVEVHSSHCGLPYSGEAYRVILERLKCSEIRRQSISGRRNGWPQRVGGRPGAFLKVPASAGLCPDVTPTWRDLQPGGRDHEVFNQLMGSSHLVRAQIGQRIAIPLGLQDRPDRRPANRESRTTRAAVGPTARRSLRASDQRRAQIRRGSCACRE